MRDAAITWGIPEDLYDEIEACYQEGVENWAPIVWLAEYRGITEKVKDIIQAKSQQTATL